jgi:FkbM family methyltransferase
MLAEVNLPGGVEAFVRALYRKLLLRDPEPGGLELHVKRAAALGLGPEQILDVFLGSPEFSSAAHALARQYGDSPRLIHDHSQNGEVDFLLRAMVNEGARHRFIVDVGARGRDRSNSYDLLKHLGWSGLLIEANPNLIEGIKADFAGLRVNVVNAAVADYEGEAQFFIGVNDDVSSLSERASEWGDLRGACMVTVRRLASILSETGVPLEFDVLSVDIEGFDIPVFSDLIATSRYRPRWVILEVYGAGEVKKLSDLPFHESVVREYELAGAVGPNLFLKRAGAEPA